MAIPVARMHLAVAHAALPALLPTPPKWKMLPLLPMPPLLPTPPCVAAILPLAKRPGRADSVERWDAHKKPASPPASSSPSSSGSGASSFVSSSSSKRPISRFTSSTERWDVHKERRVPAQADQRLDSGSEGSSTGNGSDIDDTEEEEIVWKPQAMYAGPGFVVAAPESSVLPMPTALFLVPIA